VLGYNFSLAGVCGRVTAPLGRGHALTVGMDGSAEEVPVPNGTIWNMVYDRNAPAGTLAPISHEELWRRLQRFLEEVIPVAEQAGVKLAAHPDDPPMPTMRQQPRLVYQPHMYQRLIDLAPSRNNALELCVGTLAEMTEGNIYDAVDQYSQQGKIAYIHLRNVVGKVPHYRETFIDEGDVDMVRILSILHRPYSADVVFRAVARGNGAHSGFYARGEGGHRVGPAIRSRNDARYARYSRNARCQVT
jgi:mannonate dehydratase